MFHNVTGIYRRDDCKPAIIWSALMSKSATQDSRVELLESGSTTPSSTERGDDIDSSSVTTSSSSEVTAVIGRRPDRALGPTTPAVAGARPKHAADLHRSPDRPTTRSTYYKDRRVAHENDGFVRDDDVVKSAVETRRYPLQYQQQQQQQLATDAHTHCISVELHTTPRDVFAQQTGNQSMI